jgi:hypothetical protein
MTERAYGHNGYTGTSIWIDPDREMFVVLLTNRVHAAKAQRPARIIADVRSDLSDAAVLAVMDGPTPVLAMPSAFRADAEVGWTAPKAVRCTKAMRARTARSKRSRVRCATTKTTKARSSKSRSAKSKSSSAKRSTVKSKTSKKKAPVRHTTTSSRKKKAS